MAIRAIFPLFGSLQVMGAENLPSQGSVILAANHLTNFDVFAMQLVLPRPIFFMGKEELFRSPILDWLLRQCGGFPVYRGERDQWALRHAQAVLRRGLVLGIFPEGSRNKGKGLHTAKTGAARLALSENCPIVPLAVNGTQFMFRGFSRRASVRLHVGRPIYPKSDENVLELTDRMMFALADLLPVESRGVYAHRPTGF